MSPAERKLAAEHDHNKHVISEHIERTKDFGAGKQVKLIGATTKLAMTDAEASDLAVYTASSRPPTLHPIAVRVIDGVGYFELTKADQMAVLEGYYCPWCLDLQKRDTSKFMWTPTGSRSSGLCNPVRGEGCGNSLAEGIQIKEAC